MILRPLPSISPFSSGMCRDCIQPLSRRTVSRACESVSIRNIPRTSLANSQGPYQGQPADYAAPLTRFDGEFSPIGEQSGRLEPMLVDAQASYLRLERRARDPEAGCGAGRAGDPAATFGQGRFNHFPFLVCERSGQGSGAGAPCQGLVLQPAFVHRKRIAVAQNRRSLDDVLQFADISRPGVSLQQLERRLFDSADIFPGLGRIALGEVLGQHRNVLDALAQRRHLQRKDVQPVEQIEPDAAGATVLTCANTRLSAFVEPIISSNVDACSTSSLSAMFSV